MSLPLVQARVTLTLDLPAVAALISSLAVLGPSVSPSAASAMRKLTKALHPQETAGAISGSELTRDTA